MSEYKLLPDGSVVPIIDAPSNVNSNGPGAEGNRQDEKEAGSLALQPVEPPQCRWPKCDCEIPKCWQPAPPPAAVPAQPAEPHPWADLDHPVNRIEGAQPAEPFDHTHPDSWKYEAKCDPTEGASEVPQAPQWISVEERMPAVDQAVALLNANGWENCHFDRNLQAAGFLAEGGYWSVLGQRALTRESFTHWMPLPAPPNVSSKEPAAEGLGQDEKTGSGP